jgi:hypothetical protein
MTTTEHERKNRGKNELFANESDLSNARADSSAGRRKTFTLKSKQLPADFANQVLNLEL